MRENYAETRRRCIELATGPTLFRCFKLWIFHISFLYHKIFGSSIKFLDLPCELFGSCISVFGFSKQPIVDRMCIIRKCRRTRNHNMNVTTNFEKPKRVFGTRHRAGKKLLIYIARRGNRETQPIFALLFLFRRITKENSDFVGEAGFVNILAAVVPRRMRNRGFRKCVSVSSCVRKATCR